MLRFLLRRFFWFAVTVFAVVTVSFFLMRSVRGGPFDGERTLTPAIEANIEARYHLDWPLWKQYLDYVGPLNLGEDGFRWLSWVEGADPGRRVERVRSLPEVTTVEGAPQPIPHLAAVATGDRSRIDRAVAGVAVGDAEGLAELASFAGADEPGSDPVLPGLLTALHRELALEAGPGPIDPGASIARLSRALEERTGHDPHGAFIAPGLTADTALVRHWFGWYFANGGDRRWRTGEDPWHGLLVGDLGPSFRYRDFTVRDILEQSLPISVRLGLLALAWALALGLTAGLASALRPGSGLDLGMRLAATAGIALPNFVIAGILVTAFVFWIPLFPVAGWGGLEHMALPGFCLGAPFAAYIARLTRTGMLESLAADHIRTARAKGLSGSAVVMRHALKGGILPVVSYLGPATAGILTGSLVIERIFFIPGAGSHFINSATNRDYTLSMGVTILYTVLVYGLNTLVDLAYTFLDPRIDLEGE